MIVQDSIREDRLIDIFKLNDGDGNRIGVDAYDEFGNPFELKTTSKGSVSTARDLGRKHIEKWRQRYWIIATFSKDKQDEFQSFYFLSRQHMEGWYNNILSSFDTKETLISEALCKLNGSFEQGQIDQLKYWMSRGILKNDPNISLSYIRKNGIEITTDHANRLRELVNAYPITKPDDPQLQLGPYIQFD